MSPRERTDPDSWRAETPATAATWLAGLSVPWWIAGGWTIDLFLGAQTRAHGDVDVGIRRADLAVVRAHLSTWEMFEAKDGVLTRLQEGVDARGDVHSLWCRPAGTALWALELMLDDGEGETWIYRRAPSIRRPLSTVIRRTPSGMPHSAPEVQLLYKARNTRPRDQLDFEATASKLDAIARAWLSDGLQAAEPGHPWIAALGAASTAHGS